MNLQNKIGFKNIPQAPAAPKMPELPKTSAQSKFTPINNEWFSKSAFTYGFPQFFNMPNLPQMPVATNAYPKNQVNNENKPQSSGVAQSAQTSKVVDLFDEIVKNLGTVSKASTIEKSEKTIAVTVNKTDDKFVWKNDLRRLMNQNKANIYALIIRTFNAQDKDGDELVDKGKGERVGNFINAIDRLDELKSYGINTIHMLPPFEVGQEGKLGNAGSVYAAKNYLKLDPNLYDPNTPTSLTQEEIDKQVKEISKDIKGSYEDLKAQVLVREQCQKFIQEAHKRGVNVMIDLPSCVSIDNDHKELEARVLKPKMEENGKPVLDENGKPVLEKIPKVPQGWEDIRAFETFENEEHRVLNKNLVDLHYKFVDMWQGLGADGIRADVARYKPTEFWDKVINYARAKDPQFAFLAESYTYEDATPMANIPADRPEDLLKVGFDTIYGQYHIFHQWKNGKEFHDYITSNLEMSFKLPPNKSLIGSFVTHDDKSPMCNGGATYCNLTTGIQATLPMINPYFVTGFESGDWYNYSYKVNKSLHLNTDWIDIFNYSRKPGGQNPEIGDYMSKMLEVRKQYEDVITKGSYIPLKVEGNKEDLVISYVRHLNGKTLLAIANKDTNAVQAGKVLVPTLKAGQELKDLAPANGAKDNYSAEEGAVTVNLAPNGFHLFEIDTPDIEKHVEKVYKQNLDPKFDYEKDVKEAIKTPMVKRVDSSITSGDLNSIFEVFNTKK